MNCFLNVTVRHFMVSNTFAFDSLVPGVKLQVLGASVKVGDQVYNVQAWILVFNRF